MPGPTKGESEFVINLLGVSDFIEQQETLDESLHELANMVAIALDSQNCSIMLLKEEHDDEEIHLRVSAHSGNLPEDVYSNLTKKNQTIAGTVASTGEPLLVADIKSSDFADMATRSTDTDGGFISIPLVISKHVIGVININHPVDKRIYSLHDLDLATILSMFISKSIHTIQLQNLLKSNFALAALAKDESMSRSNPGSFTHQPEKVAKILAKGFYNDMKQAGMGPDHILKAATEIIDLLQNTLARHKKREARNKS